MKKNFGDDRGDSMIQCKAIKANGERCGNRVVRGREVCRFHGGSTPAGIGNPLFRNGRHSKYLPDRLIAQYNEAQTDPQLLSLRAEVSLVDTRLDELLTKVDTKESGYAWSRLKVALTEFKKAQALGKVDRAMDALYDLEALINTGGKDYLVWQEIAKTIELRKALVESERRHLVEMHQMISGESVMVLLAAVLDVIRKNEPDRQILARISEDIRGLISERTSGRTDIGRETALIVQGVSREI
jgi:hypothetical protein